MNAGGVPNTCKSSGKALTVYLTEPGRDCAAIASSPKKERWLSFSEEMNGPASNLQVVGEVE